MLLMNGSALPDPHGMSVHCLPGENGAVIRELRIHWLDCPLAAAAAILGPCQGMVNLSFIDPVTGQRQTLPMKLSGAQADVAREGPEGVVYERLYVCLREG